jgi:hypothetical protein
MRSSRCHAEISGDGRFVTAGAADGQVSIMDRDRAHGSYLTLMAQNAACTEVGPDPDVALTQCLARWDSTPGVRSTQ